MIFASEKAARPADARRTPPKWRVDPRAPPTPRSAVPRREWECGVARRPRARAETGRDPTGLRVNTPRRALPESPRTLAMRVASHARLPRAATVNGSHARLPRAPATYRVCSAADIQAKAQARLSLALARTGASCAAAALRLGRANVPLARTREGQRVRATRGRRSDHAASASGHSASNRPGAALPGTSLTPSRMMTRPAMDRWE